jgi:hypothetical protein
VAARQPTPHLRSKHPKPLRALHRCHERVAMVGVMQVVVRAAGCCVPEDGAPGC